MQLLRAGTACVQQAPIIQGCVVIVPHEKYAEVLPNRTAAPLFELRGQPWPSTSCTRLSTLERFSSDSHQRPLKQRPLCSTEYRL